MRHRWGVYTCSTSDSASSGRIRASKELKPLKVKAVKLFVTVNGLIGDVSVSFQFRNHLGLSCPAAFMYPLTNNTALKQCHATVTSSRDESRRSVVLECHQSASSNSTSDQVGFVVEQSASDILQLQLGVILPADEITITLQYAITLDISESGAVKFVFPTFLPHQLQSNYTELCASDTYHSIDLQCRAVVSGEYRIHRVLSEQRLRVQYKNEARNHVQIDTVGVYSPLKDFTFSLLYSGLDRPHLHLHNPVCESGGRDHWLLSSYCAHLTMYHSSRKVPTTNTKNEYILCIDRSASMYGEKLAHVKETVQYFIRFLKPGSYFNIISFGSTVQPLFKTSQKLVTYTARKAMKLRRSLRADMLGTDVMGLLRHLYSQPNQTHNCKQVYLITDGAVERPEECIELVRKNRGKCRMFTFGLDKTASRYLVTHLAKAGSGRCYHIRNPSHLCQKVMDAMRYASQSSITSLKISMFVPEGLHLTTQPEVLPDVLFAEDTLSLRLIISGQPYDSRKTKCRVVLTGRLDTENIEYVKEFDLRHALVTHGSPLHQLAMQSHLHSLLTDTKACNSAEEILEINEEILDLSATSNLVSRNTSYVSVDSQSRQVLNSLPIILCRPENNRTQFSSVIRIKFAGGIDIFRSNQAMLRSLVSAYATRNQDRSTPARPPVQLPVIGSLPHSQFTQHRTRNASRISKRRDVMDGHRSSVDRILDQVGGVRLAEPDTDSLQSSLINTEMDSMSYGRYEEESLPPELFNIIEEYPDKGRGSGFDICPTHELQRPNDLLDMLQNERTHVKLDNSSPGKLVSTSDYYSMEVSPVSDTVSISRNTSRDSRSIWCRQDRPSCARRLGNSREWSDSSGIETNSTCQYFASSSDSSLKHTTPDSEPQYSSLWKQFRVGKRINLSGMDLDDCCSDTPTDELLRFDPIIGGIPLSAATPQAIAAHILDPQHMKSSVQRHQYANPPELSSYAATEELPAMSISRQTACPKGATLFPVANKAAMSNTNYKQYKPLSITTNFDLLPVDHNNSHSRPVTNKSHSLPVTNNTPSFPIDKSPAHSTQVPKNFNSISCDTPTQSIRMMDEDTSSENLSDVVRDYCKEANRCLPVVKEASSQAKPLKGWQQTLRCKFKKLKNIFK